MRIIIQDQRNINIEGYNSANQVVLQMIKGQVVDNVFVGGNLVYWSKKHKIMSRPGTKPKQQAKVDSTCELMRLKYLFQELDSNIQNHWF